MGTIKIRDTGNDTLIIERRSDGLALAYIYFKPDRPGAIAQGGLSREQAVEIARTCARGLERALPAPQIRGISVENEEQVEFP